MPDISEDELEFYGSIIIKLGGLIPAVRFLRNELVITEAEGAWRERAGIIDFTVISDGTDGEGWIARLAAKGHRISKVAERLLRSSDFVPTSGVTHRIAVLRKNIISDNCVATTATIRGVAGRLGMLMPTAEVACLIMERLTTQDLAAMLIRWIATMHEPIEDSDVGPLLLFEASSAQGHFWPSIEVMSQFKGRKWLHAIHGKLGDRWSLDGGFAFIAPLNYLVR